jgi:poly(A) polymerase
VEAAAGQRLALVGGVVRDLLLHRHHQDPWRGLPDLDLVVEGRAADLVERLPEALQHQLGRRMPFRQRPHGRYGTVELELQLPQELGGCWLLDLASARREVYPAPGSNPEVSPGSLEQDLARRDVSVNAMALELLQGPSCDADLLDPHDGQADLAARHLRFLHSDSIRDDPTRVVRAARYAARLDFSLAPDSLELITTTVNAWPWPWLPGDSPEAAPAPLATRLRMEMELMFQREPWRQALMALHAWGGLELLDASLQGETNGMRRLAWGERLGLPLLMTLVAGSVAPVDLAARLQLPRRQQDWLSQFLRLREDLLSTTLPRKFPSSWCKLFETQGFCPEAVALALVSGIEPRRPLLRWWYDWRYVKAPKSPELLMQEGFSAGPDLGYELQRLRAELLDRFSES